MLDTGCWILVTGYWLLGADYWLQVDEREKLGYCGGPGETDPDGIVKDLSQPRPRMSRPGGVNASHGIKVGNLATD